MKIIRDAKASTLTLVPNGGGERKVIASIIKRLKSGGLLSYGGRKDVGSEGFCELRFHVGAKEKERSTTHGKMTVTQPVHVGVMQFMLRGSTKADKHEVSRIRDLCDWSRGGGLVFLGDTRVEKQKAIMVIGSHCERCKANMITRCECEWGVCDACAKKCKHEFTQGVVHGGKSGSIGFGEFCTTCGRANPNPTMKMVKMTTSVILVAA